MQSAAATPAYIWALARLRRFLSGLRTGLAILLLPGAVFAANAATPDSLDVELRVKAAFVYNFARFVEWPGRPGAGPIRIGVLGHGEFAPVLEEIAQGKAVGGHSIAITPVAAVAEAESCEILVIERSASGHQKEIAQALADKPVLTVADDENGLQDGIMIAFQLIDESVRFHINQEAASRAGLKISSQLLKVALPNPRRPQ